MTTDNLPNEHLECMQWAIFHGAEVRGVTPARFPGRGLGMVATRTIEVSTTSIQRGEHSTNLPIQGR